MPPTMDLDALGIKCARTAEYCQRFLRWIELLQQQGGKLTDGEDNIELDDATKAEIRALLVTKGRRFRAHLEEFIAMLPEPGGGGS